MELQINQFWILKVHSMINSTSEYEPSLLNTLCATWVKKLTILQRMYELISAFATERFCSFWKTISPRISYTNSSNFHHVLNSTSSLASWSQFISSSLLYVKPYAMSKNVNNDISKDPPIQNLSRGLPVVEQLNSASHSLEDIMVCGV